MGTFGQVRSCFVWLGCLGIGLVLSLLAEKAIVKVTVRGRRGYPPSSTCCAQKTRTWVPAPIDPSVNVFVRVSRTALGSGSKFKFSFGLEIIAYN